MCDSDELREDAREEMPTTEVRRTARNIMILMVSVYISMISELL